LGQQQEALRKKGVGVASISYDSIALLKDFAERKGLTYPLLSDPDSKVIRAFNILNGNFPEGHAWHGVPFPGIYVIDEKGIVRAKYFEEDHRDRYTASNIVIHEFNGEGQAGTTVETKHLKLTYSTSDTSLSPGGRAALMMDIELKKGMHVYAPGVQGGYIPIDWKIAESKGWLAHPVSYPASRIMHLPAINESVPVYEGRFRLLRDVTIGQTAEIKPLLADNGTLTVEGSFRHQACDEKECFPPQTVPLKWTFQIAPLDGKRAPAELQRKARGSF
jgi:AhpC/TSA family/Disulphide bond corrector protein DsbC